MSSGFPRWWRLGLAITEVVLAAGLIMAAVTEGAWYWWAGDIAAIRPGFGTLDDRDRAGRVRTRIHRREGMPLGEATEPKSTHARCKLAGAAWT